MNCPNCGEAVEAGAAFCGNCGQALTSRLPQALPTAALTNNPVPGVALGTDLTAGAAATIPVYAVPLTSLQNAQMKATMSMVVAVLGIAGAILMPLIGLALGVIGIILATLSRRVVRHGLSTVGIVISVLAIVAGIGSWTLAVSHDKNLKHKVIARVNATNDAPAQATTGLITPCYSIKFRVKVNVENVNGSCDMNAFNGDSFNNSDDAYKIYATSAVISPSAFTNLAKQAIEKDIKQSLPSFIITKEVAGQFAGSPAYFVTTSNQQNVSLMEAAVLHTTANGANFFVFVHAVGSNSVNLNTLESGWNWE